VTAAQLHVKSATAGDVVSIGNLITYRDEIEHEALQGSLRAALALAKMYDDGLGVEKNLAVAYAWLLIGKRCGVRDDDQAARDELYEHTLTVYSDLSSDEKAEAYRLAAIMARARTSHE